MGQHLPGKVVPGLKATVCTLPGAIGIHFYYNDHLPPHFHADAAGWEIRVEIVSFAISLVSGSMPQSKVLHDVLDFAARRQSELSLCWTRCQAGAKPGKVAP